MKKIKKFRLCLLYVLPLLFIIPSVSVRLTKSYTLFPSEKAVKYFPYADSTDSAGNSSVTNFFVSDTSIEFSFTLRDSSESPYAGFQIDYATDSTIIDISKYSTLEFELNTDNLNKMTVYLKTAIEGVTVLSDYKTHLFLEREVEIKKGNEKYQLDLSKFYTPQWWYKDMNFTEKEVGEPDFSKFLNIVFSSAPYAKIDTNFSFSINSIRLIKDTKNVDLWSFISFVISNILIFVLIVIVKKKELLPVIIPYKTVDLGNCIDEDAKRIMEYISENYTDSNISVMKVSEFTGVSINKIPGIIKKSFGFTFKQYLNSIRLAEVKRLLVETDRQVTEIAHQVGYNNATHFHRTFKAVENISPNEYRKNNGQKDDN